MRSRSEAEQYAHAVQSLQRLDGVVVAAVREATDTSPLRGIACEALRSAVVPFFDIDDSAFHRLIEGLVRQGKVVHDAKLHMLRAAPH